MPDYSKLNLRDLCFQLSFNNNYVEQDDSDLYEVLQPDIPNEEELSLHVLDTSDEPSLFATDPAPLTTVRQPASTTTFRRAAPPLSRGPQVLSRQDKPDLARSASVSLSTTARSRPGNSATTASAPRARPTPPAALATRIQNRSPAGSLSSSRLHSRSNSAASSVTKPRAASSSGLRTVPPTVRPTPQKDPLIEAFELDLGAEDFKLVL